jgi:hypothetical protein
MQKAAIQRAPKALSAPARVCDPFSSNRRN